MTDYVSFAIRCNIRDWVYRVRVTRKTGHVVHIRAGCQFWQSFKQAQGHYNPIVNGPRIRWSDRWLEIKDTGFTQEVRLIETQWRLRAERMEARAILARLENRVKSYQYQCRKRSKRK